MFVRPQQAHIETPNPRVMVSERGALGRGLGHVGGALVNEIRVPLKDTLESTLAPSALEDTER